MDLKMPQIYVKEKPNRGEFAEVDCLDDMMLGLNVSSLKLFFTKQHVELWEALDKMEGGLLVTGPPGVGKSCTTWAWLSHQVFEKGKSALWVPVKEQRYFIYMTPTYWVKYEGKFDDICETVANSLADIIVLDGTTDKTSEQIIEAAKPQTKGRRRQRIEVASIGRKVNYGDLLFKGVETFEMCGWLKEDYIKACDDNEFYDRVKDNFRQSDDNENVDKERLISQKYFYAGSSARWMFGRPVSSVIKEIKKYWKRPHDIRAALANNIAEGSKDVVNHLYMELESPNGERERSFTSDYVVQEGTNQCGRQSLDVAYEIANKLNRPAMKGWLAELDFGLSLKEAAKSEKNTIFLYSEGKKEPDVQWDAKRVFECHWSKLESHKNAILDGHWWDAGPDQGGFDYACLTNTTTNEFLLRFVQVAYGAKHSLKLHYFKYAAGNFSRVLGEEKLERIEIVFVVRDKMQRSFKVETPKANSTENIGLSTNETVGCLANWKVGETNEMWDKSEYKKVKKLGFRFNDRSGRIIHQK